MAFKQRRRTPLLLFSGAAIAALSLAMALAWLTRMRTGQSGWIDAIWSAATGLAAFVLALAPPSAAPFGRRALAAGLVLIWAARLAGHIFARTRGAGDDPRYAALAREWGAAFPRRLFVFLQIQAAAALPLVGAVALAARSPRPFPDLFDLAGGLVAIAALAGEGLADAQLAQFRRAAPSGGLCEIGLWGASRHPNYFFEFLFWCAWPLIAFDPSGAYPRGLLALAAPAFIYWLLAHVSGVPPLEKHMRASRGAAFDDYARRVNRFFPGPRINFLAPRPNGCRRNR
jgi:steroid 5-alpha reductase family enzyme